MNSQQAFQDRIRLTSLIGIALMMAILPRALAGSSVDTLKICVGEEVARPEAGVYRVPVRLESAKEHQLFFIALTFAYHKKSLRLPKITFPKDRDGIWSYAYGVSAGDHLTDTLRIALLRQKALQKESGGLLLVEFEALTDSLAAPICRMVATKMEGKLDSTFILVEQSRDEKPDLSAPGFPPLAFALSQNYPNPFNAGTTIEFRLPYATPVKVCILNTLGELVTVLAEKNFDPGQHAVIWPGRNHAGEEVASGVYFYEIRAGSFVQRHKMLLLR